MSVRSCVIRSALVAGAPRPARAGFPGLFCIATSMSNDAWALLRNTEPHRPGIRRRPVRRLSGIAVYRGLARQSRNTELKE